MAKEELLNIIKNVKDYQDFVFTGDKKRLVVSFSSGETSAFMCQWIKRNLSNRFDIIYVIANTGEENEASLVFADKCDKYFGLNLIWLECITNPVFGKGVKAKVVSFETASRDGKPFEEMIAKHGIPNKKFSHCSRELKQRTIRAYARAIGWKGYYTAIGYRSDEADRMNAHYREEKHIYPLIFSNCCPMTKPQINKFWSQMPFRLQEIKTLCGEIVALKGYEDNCKVCYKKTLRKLLTIAKHTPERFDNFRKWEKKYENYIPPTRTKSKAKLPLRFFRDNLSVDEIIELSKKPFEESPDDRIEQRDFKETTLDGHELDVSNGCIESCEVF